ncbi:transcription factor divaricata [Phtheirospermum japonicum]|uniref:Transcription factor divaricata n=1 Tax=Phtheirospermum japonicum TaxID=374723 RepID=A0A830B918_9LAMI|nr:transcription factor divaricata [Phtheirospermum japonicum]
MRCGGMEILSPSSYFCNSSWLVEDNNNNNNINNNNNSSMSTRRWTAAENKAFENALAVFDENTPDRWHKVAAMVPGKTVGDVIRQYKELEDDVTSIEAGLVPVPGYATSSSLSSPFTLEWGSTHAYAAYGGFKQSYGGRKLSSSPSVRPSSDQERKKGVPWTEEEHKTPTQVASHAQKYFIRQLSGGKDKRRASIHDITTVNLNDSQTTTTDYKRKETKTTAVGFSSLSSSPCNHGRNMFVSSPYGINSYGDAIRATSSFMGSQNMAFQMQPGLHYPNA